MSKINLLFFFLLILSCTSRENSVDLFQSINSNPESIVFTNSIPHDNQEGHVQGIQLFKHKGKDYYFLSGSSTNQAYYTIVEVESKQVISTNELLSGDFRHAGGFQITGDLLAVGIEDNIKVDKSKVQILKILDPKQPDLSLLKTIDRSGSEKRYTAGCVGITIQQKDLMVAVGNWDSKNIDFYSLPKNKLNDPNVNFQLVYSFDSEVVDKTNWVDTVWYSYQNINFISDDNKNLYLLGTAQKDSTGIQIADLFELYPDENSMDLKKIIHKSFAKPDSTSFKWGGGIYWNKKNQFQLFSTSKYIRDSLIISRY